MLNQELEQDSYTTALENVLQELLECFEDDGEFWTFVGFDEDGDEEEVEVFPEVALTIERAQRILATHEEDLDSLGLGAD
jgi:hypothetical protein